MNLEFNQDNDDDDSVTSFESGRYSVCSNSSISEFDFESEDSLSDVDEIDDFDENDELIYPGARLTIGESMTCILKLYLQENLSKSCLSKLLSIIEMHCPERNKCAKTLYFFQKWLRQFEVPFEKHFYCSECCKKLNNANELCELCPEPKSVCYFITFPLEAQLQKLFERPGFYDSLGYRFDKQKHDDRNLEDIYDGNIYQSFCTRNSQVNLKNQLNISFIWNSDGVPLYNSSKFSIWPEYFMINELPPDERKKASNMLVPGLWFGTKKPDANLFLEPLAENLERIRNGILLFVADLDRHRNVKVIPLCSTCDMPAKAIFMNMKQYNSTFGCHRCKIKTISVGRKRAYQQVDNLPLRTTEGTETYAEQAVNNNFSVFGVKGPTYMSKILPDFIRNTVIDPMHMIMGVTKLLFRIWFFSNDVNLPAGAKMSEHFHSVRQRILSIAPPSFVPRVPDYHVKLMILHIGKHQKLYCGC